MQKKQIDTTHPDPDVADCLTKMAALASLPDLLIQARPGPAPVDPVLAGLAASPPARLGAYLDRLCQLARQAHLPARIDTGGAIFHPVEGRFEAPGQPPALLTEKERDVLVALARAPGRTLSRRELLETVWDYADSAETHTVETHIYRLRQKIEADPSSPRYLLTREQGYQLADA